MPKDDGVRKLIINRRSGQGFYINDVLILLEFASYGRGRFVRVTIEAPEVVRVLRQEIKQREDDAKRKDP